MAKEDRIQRRIDRVEGRMQKARSKGKSNKYSRLSDKRSKLKSKLYTCRTLKNGNKVCNIRPKKRKTRVK